MIILFDFDGVIADTEEQYTLFWNRKGKEYLGQANLRAYHQRPFPASHKFENSLYYETYSSHSVDPHAFKHLLR